MAILAISWVRGHVEKYFSWWTANNAIYESSNLHIVHLLIAFVFLCLFALIIFIPVTRNRNTLSYFVFRILSIIGMVYVLIMPWLFPTTIKPDVVVNICGSVTLGEDFAVPYIEAISRNNHAAKVVANYNRRSKGIFNDVDVYLTNVVSKKKRYPEFRDLSLVHFNIDAKGTTDGFNELLKEDCDVSMASTSAKNAGYEEQEDNLDGMLLGKDAIAVVVGFDNDILDDNEDVIDYDTLKEIFTQPSEWKVFHRKKSGTTKELQEYLEFGNNDVIQGDVVSSNADMLEKVKSQQNSIGYLSYSFLRYQPGSIRVIRIRKDGNITEKPSNKCISDRSCAMVRNLHLYNRKDLYSTEEEDSKRKIAKKILAYGQNPLGQEIIEAAGFIPIIQGDIPPVSTSDPVAIDIDIDVEDIYEALHSERVEPIKTITYGRNGYDLTEKQKGKLKESLEGYKDTELVLIGHTTRTGDPFYNDGLSWERARVLRNKLLSMGFNVKLIYGFGQKYPLLGIESNLAENRRVEIYSYQTFLERANNN
ncbi:substrate-binding domain-containing protein [Okeania sp. SIO1F9]|uniref:substrate-binding domain-containing protein n=1 Tax=Okeania sp. SIO1F9 TaxID=2607813 RepID=UPI00257A78F5|nr:substrate-binding domain-containing protein [Okeania sp. SIO1F9]